MTVTFKWPALVVLDANILIKHVDPATSSDDIARLDHLFAMMHKHRSTIVVPAPCWSEYLVLADRAVSDATAKRSSVFIAPFDTVAAYECAKIERDAIDRGDKKGGMLGVRQSIKVDRQIAAIAKAKCVSLIVTCDHDLRKAGEAVNITVCDINELPLPASAMQQAIPFTV